LLAELDRLIGARGAPLPPSPQIVTPVIGSQPLPPKPRNGVQGYDLIETAPESRIETPSQRKLFVIAGAALIALVIVVASALMFLGGGDNAQNDAGQTAQQPTKTAAQPPARSDQPATQLRTFTLELSEGQADVYKNGQKIGATPYRFDARPGEQIELV